jgi:hypothetical protein
MLEDVVNEVVENIERLSGLAAYIEERADEEVLEMMSIETAAEALSSLIDVRECIDNVECELGELSFTESEFDALYTSHGLPPKFGGEAEDE